MSEKIVNKESKMPSEVIKKAVGTDIVSEKNSVDWICEIINYLDYKYLLDKIDKS